MADSSDKTILSVDYGTKRIGLAKSDSLGIIATAVDTLEVKSASDALRKVRQVIERIRPAAIVIGYPLLQSGDRSDSCIAIDGFIEKLSTTFKGPIHRVDEADTSIEAVGVIRAHGKRVGRDKKRVDRLAAVIILQRFLDERDAKA